MAENKKHEEHAEKHFREKHLMLDPLPRGQMNEMVMESMHTTSWKFWVVFAILSAIVAYGLFYSWGVMIAEGLGVAGVNRPTYWGIFLVNTVFWIGISHAGTFISAILRVFRANSAAVHALAELMTFWLGAGWFQHLHAHGPCVAFMLAYAYPNQRMLWLLHSPHGTCWRSPHTCFHPQCTCSAVDPRCCNGA